MGTRAKTQGCKGASGKNGALARGGDGGTGCSGNGGGGGGGYYGGGGGGSGGCCNDNGDGSAGGGAGGGSSYAEPNATNVHLWIGRGTKGNGLITFVWR